MDKFVILPDVTCDLSEELREFFGIDDYVKGHIHFQDGRDFSTTLDWSEISQSDFYKILNNKNAKVTTAPPSQEEYYQAFEKYVTEGFAVISMSISSKISGTYDFSCVAAERIREKYPEAKIHCVDSSRMSAGFGILVCYSKMLQDSGKSYEEVVEWIESNKFRVHQMGPIDDLIVVARRGRITMGKAIMGSFAGVKPMGDYNRDGYTTVLTKVKGIKKALETTVKYVAETATDIENNYVIIAHTDRAVYAETLKEMIESTLHPKKVFVTDVFCGCGPNIGPGMVGAYYFGDPISNDLEAEKDAINRILK